MTDDPRVPDRSLEREFDPDGEREIDPIDGDELPESIHDAHPEAPDADVLEQSLVVPLDDED